MQNILILILDKHSRRGADNRCQVPVKGAKIYIVKLHSKPYTDHAGLEISVNSRIAWPFLQQIAIGNAGPISALESMGSKPTFRCHFLNIGPSYKQ